MGSILSARTDTKLMCCKTDDSENGTSADHCYLKHGKDGLDSRINKFATMSSSRQLSLFLHLGEVLFLALCQQVLELADLGFVGSSNLEVSQTGNVIGVCQSGTCVSRVLEDSVGVIGDVLAIEAQNDLIFNVGGVSMPVSFSELISNIENLDSRTKEMLLWLKTIV